VSRTFLLSCTAFNAGCFAVFQESGVVLECWSCRISLYDSWFGSSSVIGVLPYLGDNLWKASFVVVPQSTGGRWFLRIILANLSGKVFFFF